MHNRPVNRDAVAKAKAAGDMFYAEPTGSHKYYRVCQRHQPRSSYPDNLEIDFNAIKECATCSEIDPRTFEDIPR